MMFKIKLSILFVSATFFSPSLYPMHKPEPHRDGIILDEDALYVQKVIDRVERSETASQIIYTAIHAKDPHLIRWEFSQNKQTKKICAQVRHTAREGFDLGSSSLPEKFFAYIVTKYNDQIKD